MLHIALILLLSLSWFGCAAQQSDAPPAAEPKPPAPPAPVPSAPPPTPEPPPAPPGELQTMHVVPGPGLCTLIGCPKSDPCCNRCNYSGWRLKPADEQPLRLSGVAVPDPVQEGCGVLFELDLTGHYEGDTFVVRSFEKRPSTPAPTAKRERPKPPAQPDDVQTLRVFAGPPACTRMACPESDPCCNNCMYGGWRLKPTDEEPMKLSGVPVPAPVKKKKGCGLQFLLSLTGHFEGDTFVVRSFKKRPPA